MEKVRIPTGWRVDFIVVDNGSNDGTSRVVHEACARNPRMRYVCEPQPGHSRARNSGLAASRGEIIVFTDDDVEPAEDWLERIAAPLFEGSCDAVVGRIELASRLQRPWMQGLHRRWLAVRDEASQQEVELIGANMGFRRDVLQRVPGFDPELGPGALGYEEERLFSLQLSEAGYRVRLVLEASVVHHPEPSRLQRAQWLKAACAHGRSLAYVLYHWQHSGLKHPFLRSCYLSMKLHLRRRLQPPPPPDAEGGPLWELSYVGHIAMCRQFLTERKRPRNYVRHGLIRLSSSPSPAAGVAALYLAA